MPVPPASPASVTPARLMEVFDVVGPLYRKVQRKVELGESVEGASVGVRAVMAMLAADGPMTVPQMGRAQTLSRQFVQRMVNDAKGLGWVETLANPAHRRSSLVRLTPAGVAVVDAIAVREHDVLQLVAADVSEADVETCLAVLRTLLSLFDDVDVDAPLASP